MGNTALIIGYSIALPALVWALLLGGCSGDLEPRKSVEAKNVLLISLDTLRADRLGSYGYAAARTPYLDRLAARGMRFTRATSVMPLTLPAHSSLMTGTFPVAHGVRDNGGFYLGEEQVTLAEILAGRGFRTGGFIGAFVLDSRWGIAQGFGRYFDAFDLTEFDQAPGMDAIQRPGSEVVDQALVWLEEDRERPFFAWVHLYDPHTPYEAPEPYRSAFPATRDGAYDAEIAATDAQVGRLLDALARDGRLADTLVVAVADHGEMLGEHGELTHCFFIYEAAVHIPLLIAGPGAPTAVIEDQVRIVDIFPTILGRLGIEAPATIQGADLWPLTAGKDLRLIAHSESWYPRIHYGWSELQSIQDGRYKLIGAPERELYDLALDPGETLNLAAAEPERVAAMEAGLHRLLTAAAASAPTATTPAATATPAPLDPETEARLQALGYLGSGGSGRSLEDDGVERGDPKHKIGLYNLMKEATSVASLGDLDLAITKISQALARDPDIVEAHMLLGNFHRKAERLPEAVAAYREALSRDPEHREALYSLATAYKDLGQLDEAETGFERAMELDPRNGKVLWQIADLHMRRQRFDAAEKVLLTALDLDLDRPRFLLKLGECYLEMGRPGDARVRLESALEDNPRLLGAHFSLGLAHEEEGRLQQAMHAYHQAIDLHPDAYRASFNLAKLLHRARRPEEALELFRKTVEIQPDFGVGYLYLAKALLDSGDLPGAIAAAEKGLTLDPDPTLAPLGHFVLADVYSRQGRPRDAEREAAAGQRLQAGAGSNGLR